MPKGLRLCVYEGYRSFSLQEMLFDQRLALIKSLYPAWEEEQVFNEAIKMVSPVVNRDGSKNTPPHSTGGAIDIYFINEEGPPVEMGIHPKDWMKDQDGSLSLTDSPFISFEARQNRQIMGQSLTEAGFINYPTEYWHWSYGDRYWAYHKGERVAIYDSIKA